MAEILLRELSNADIDWMTSVGTQTQIPQGTTILKPYERPEAFHILLDGELSLMGTGKGSQPSKKIATLVSGDAFGESTLFNAPLPIEVRAEQDVRLFSITQSQLADKLAKDTTFSGHFHRAIALILSDRLRKIYAAPDQLRFSSNQAVKEAMFVFGELRDSDIDWLMSVGQIQQYSAPDDFLVQAGRPVEALYIVLSGQFSVFVFDGDHNPNPFAVCFECPYETASTMNLVTSISKGEMAGTIAFLDFSPHLFSIKTNEDAMVLRVPRPQLAAKLLQDMSFSSRFHRIVCLQLLDLFQTSMGHLGLVDEGPEDIDEGVLGDEIDIEALQQASQGAARFNWMLKQLGTVS